MTGIMMAQAAAAGGAAGSGELRLDATSIVSLVFFGSFLPLTSLRLKTDGIGQKASGSTQSLLSYTNLPNDQWHTGNPITGSSYEVYFDSVTNSPTGAAGTWFGSTRNAWTGLGTQQTWTWQKNTTSFGSANHAILVEVRNIATPANTTGPVAITFISSVEL